MRMVFWRSRPVKADIRNLDHCIAEDQRPLPAPYEAAYESETDTMMGVPIPLVPKVRELIARFRRQEAATAR